MKKIATILLMLCSLTCFAQDSLVVEMLKQHRYKVSLENGVLQGEGAVWLKSESDKAQFVLLGEDHGFTQPAQFASGIFKLLYPAGYKYYVSETGPSAASILTPLLIDKDTQALSAFFQKYPMAFAFHAYREESQMVKDILHTANYNKHTVWGIDQEFIMSPAPYLYFLAKKSKEKESREVLERYAKRADSETKEMLKTKDFSKLSLQTLSKEDFDSLRSAVRKNKQATGLIDDLQRSQHIYKTNSAYASNLLRIELMKENIMKQYRMAQASGDEVPKAIFKFGAMHMFRGKSKLGFYDIGNLASELAASNNKGSLHILIAGDKGTVNKWRMINSIAFQKEVYDGQQALQSFGIKPLYSLIEGKEWQLVDLRPVREMIYNGKIKNISEQLRETIWGYDVLLLIPEVSASTNF